MKKSLLSISIFTSIILLVAACQHHPEIADILPPDDNGNHYVTPPDTIEIINTDPCDPDSVYFTNTILPLLSSNCAMADCHDAITHEEGVRMYDYAHIMQQVEAGSLSNSDLWESINENGDDMMPPSDNGGPLSADQIQAIRTWILQGARNNSCTEDCNPADFSYAANIKPIIDLTCGGCHSGNNPSGTVLLETYAQINAAALDGSLMSSLHGTNNYTLMPENSTGLPECYISQFQNWVNAGAPNN